ncbi:MAG TPA: hypothetical protein DCO71_02395 [Gammaproteobacteria bacterium]|nr:hypothetical protein [Gammaproteobacteria bacterium]
MNNKTKPWWQRLLIAAVIFEIVYLALVNLALNLPLTQTLINQHRPEKYAVHWEKAWSWRPFRVHAQGISANGQTASLQWQAEAPAATASVAILPLLRRTVRVYAVEGENLTYFQRKRPKPGKDYAASRKFFPPISGRDLDAPVTPRPPHKQGNGWTMVVEDIHASGSHRLWINQLQATLSGGLQADVSYQTRGGPFSLSNGKADVKIDALTINNGQQISTEGFLKGSVEFLPFIPSENRGMKSLAFLNLDASIATRTESLEFLNFYLDSLHGMHIDGAGNVEGRVVLAAGKLLPESALVISANELDLNFKDHIATGTGNVIIKVAADKPKELGLTIHFTTMDMHHEDDTTPLFAGNGLEVAVRGSNNLADWKNRKAGAAHAAVKIPAVSIPDLGRYQRYLPDRLAVTLNGGQGELQGQAELTQTALNSSLEIRSDHADVSFKDYRFISDLDLGIHIDIPSIAAETINISGTYLRINEARLSGRENTRAQPWNAALSVDAGRLDLSPSAATHGTAGIKGISLASRQQHFKSRLETADAHFRISGNISELDWINQLFRNPYELTITGSGQLSTDIYLESGRLAKGSQLEVLPRKMHVEVLDYAVKGDGRVFLKMVKGGQHPDLDLQVEVNDGLFKRKGDAQSFIRDVALKLHAQGDAMGFDGSGEIVKLHLQIPSATVTDMSIYDEYLPEKSPLKILGGTADLTADIQLQPTTANGFVKLITTGLRSRVDDQEIIGELTADIKLADGNPQNMEFDISGSSLLLDKIRVTGKEKNFGVEDWNARFDLKKARATWKKPVYIHAESGFEIKDSRPIVAMFANAKGEKKWLEKLLTIEDIQGTATVTLEQQQLTIPHAFSGSDKIDIGAKGIIDEQNVDGIFYARFRKLGAVLKVHDGKRNLDVLGARKKFDNYSTR